MAHPEQAPSPDPSSDPDSYYGSRYGDVEVQYHGGDPTPLCDLLQEERDFRGEEEMDNLSLEERRKRVNMFVKMLKEADVLRPEDDITYEVEEGN